MKTFIIKFNDESRKEVKAKSKNDLIKNFCLVDATVFQEKVKEICWIENGLQHIESISTGKIVTKELIKRL